MTEQERLRFAKEYIEKLANGINPLTNDLVAEKDIVNNVHISRCLFYVAGILQKNLEETPRKVTKQTMKKPPFSITLEERAAFEYSDTPIPASEIVHRLNALVDKSKARRLTYKEVVSWLVEIGMLELLQIPGGKVLRRPTELGGTYGVFVERRVGPHDTYNVILYRRNAQEFIVDNIDAIMGLAQAHDGEPKKSAFVEPAGGEPLTAMDVSAKQAMD